MRITRLQRTDRHVSRIGLGTVLFGGRYGFDQGLQADQAHELLTACQQAGVNLVDTASAYGESESRIGDFLTTHKDNSFVICSKCPTMPIGARYQELLGVSVKGSLHRLRVSQLDILLAHQFDATLFSDEEYWKGVDSLKEKGLIRLFGVSLYEPSELEFLLKTRSAQVDVVQIPYNLFDQRFKPLLEQTQRAKIDVFARSVFLKGVLAQPETSLPGELAGLKPYKARLKDFSSQRGSEVEEIALRFALESPGITSVILGMKNKSELEQNLARAQETKTTSWVGAEQLAVSDLTLIDPRCWKAL